MQTTCDPMAVPRQVGQTTLVRQSLEVKSGHNVGNVSGLAAYVQQFQQAQPLVIGTGAMPLDLWLQS